MFQVMVHSNSFLIDAFSSSLQSTIQLLFKTDAALAIVAPGRSKSNKMC